MSVNRTGCETRYYYVGATIEDRYDLTDFIGAGGMACVYLASERGTPHTFAIKFLKSEYHDLKHLVEYFETEASSMRDLAHPNIVRIYRFVRRDSYSYILMDYVDGFALSDVIKLSRQRKSYMPLDEVVRVMTQIARALDAIHRENFVHRDIKPSNVLIERNTGQAFLTDLGITSATDVKIEGAGTLAYMAPEQSETWKADQRSDIYAFGIVLFEMLTMTRPYKSNKELSGSEAEADLLRKHKEAPIPKVTDYRRGLPKELNDIIMRAMAKDPDERYQSVIAFAQDVHRVLLPKLSADVQDFTSIQHRQIAAPDTPATPERNTQLWIGIVIAAILFAGLIAVGAFLNAPEPIVLTSTPTDTETPTPSPPPTFTPTPDPLQGALRSVFLSGADVLAEPSSTEPLAVQPAEGLPLQYMRIGFVNGFGIEADISSATALTRYGFAFRVQDEANYHYFSVDTATFNYEMGTVVAGVATPAETGTFETLPQSFVIAGIDNYFEVRAAQRTIQYVSDQFPTGSLAVLLEGSEGNPDAELTFERLQINFVGEAARTAFFMTPTPYDGIGDPFRTLRLDVDALLATNDITTSTINCAPYVTTYDSLTRHLDSSNTEVVDVAQDVIDAGEFIYTLCDEEANNTEELSFDEAFVAEYGDWERDLTAIQNDLNNR